MLNGRFFRMQKLKEECDKRKHPEENKKMNSEQKITHHQLEQLRGSHWRSKL